MANSQLKRDYCFTYNISIEDEILGLKVNEQDQINMIYNKLSDFFSNDKIFKYVIFQLEQGEETKHLHFQGYFYFINGHSFSATKKLLSKNGYNSIHIEKRMADKLEDAVDYCRKEETRYCPDYKKDGYLFEYGWLPSMEEISQGKRTDLEEFRLRVNDGATYDELLDDFPFIMSKNEKFYLKLRKHYLESNYMKMKRKMFNELYYYFPNSDIVLESIYNIYGYDNVYRLPSYNKYAFDDYREQDVIVLDNYDYQFQDKFLLKLLSGFPLYLGARYENKIACFTKVIVITKLSKDEFKKMNGIFKIKDYFKRLEENTFRDIDDDIRMEI